MTFKCVNHHVSDSKFNNINILPSSIYPTYLAYNSTMKSRLCWCACVNFRNTDTGVNLRPPKSPLFIPRLIDE